MRVLILTMLTTVMGLMTVPLHAQTYDPNFPVCLHAFGREVEYFECSYTSLAQCAQSASGRNAMCIVNPYFPRAGAPADPVQRSRRAH
jgi:hypothetical protein